MDYKVSPVALDRIDTADRTFKITTQTDTTDLAFSIRAIGLLQPPVLISTGHDYAVVVGFRRIAACQALNMDGIPARILPADTSRVTCSQIAISDNAFQRPLNVVEQSRAFALIQKFCESSSSKLKVVQSTGLPDSQPAMDRIMPVAGMPADLQEAILNGSIALPIALQIIQLEKDNAVALSRLFRKLATGLNIQRELLALISDIAHRDDISMASVD